MIVFHAAMFQADLSSFVLCGSQLNTVSASRTVYNFFFQSHNRSNIPLSVMVISCGLLCSGVDQI